MRTLELAPPRIVGDPYMPARIARGLQLGYLPDPWSRRFTERRAWKMGAVPPQGIVLPSGSPKVGTTALPTGASKPILLPFSRAKGASGGTIYESVGPNTSAAAAAPTQQLEYLVGIVLRGGGAGGAGAWEFLYDGTHQAIFPVGASGLDPTGAIGPSTEMFYPLNYGPIGTNIPAAVQTYGGGLASVRFIFSNRPNPLGYRISAFTGVFVTGNESGTSGTSKTYSIPGALGKPTGIIALSSIQAGTATGIPLAAIFFPAIGNYAQYAVPAALSRGYEYHGYHLWPVPDYDPAASFALTHKAESLGAATDVQIAGSLYYTQAVLPSAKA